MEELLGQRKIELLNRFALLVKKVRFDEKERRVVVATDPVASKLKDKEKKVVNFDKEQARKKKEKERKTLSKELMGKKDNIVIKEGNTKDHIKESDEDAMVSPQVLPFRKHLKMDEKDLNGASNSRIGKNQEKEIS